MTQLYNNYITTCCVIYKVCFLCLLKRELLQQLCNETNLFILELNIFESLLFLCIFFNSSFLNRSNLKSFLDFTLTGDDSESFG